MYSVVIFMVCVKVLFLRNINKVVLFSFSQFCFNYMQFSNDARSGYWLTFRNLLLTETQLGSALETRIVENYPKGKNDKLKIIH